MSVAFGAGSSVIVKCDSAMNVLKRIIAECTSLRNAAHSKSPFAIREIDESKMRDVRDEHESTVFRLRSVRRRIQINRNFVTLSGPYQTFVKQSPGNARPDCGEFNATLTASHAGVDGPIRNEAGHRLIPAGQGLI